MNSKIAVALVCDNNYVMQSSVVIASIIANSNKIANYEIFILCKNIEEKNINILEKMSTENVVIHVVLLNNDFDDIVNNTKWNNIIFEKFKIPFIIKDYEKVLFLDADTIVNSDLSELYNTDLNDKYVGVVNDITLILQKELYPNFKNYFNAGMILFNSKKIKEDFLLESFITYYKDNIDKCFCPEQDTFNYLFGHKIVYLPLKYQYIILYDYYLINNLMKFYNIKNKNNIKEENISIFHYVTLNPWKYWNTPYVKLWDKYHKLSPYFKPLKRRFYNPLFNIYRRIRYNYRFFKYKYKLI